MRGPEAGLTRYRNYLKLLQTTIKQREDIKVYLELLLTLAAISFFTWFAIRPTFVTILTVVKQIKTQEEIVAQLDRKLAGLGQANEARQQFKRDAEVTNQALPDNESPAQSLRQIEALARQQGVILVNSGVEKSSSNFVSLLVVIRGEPQRVFSFLEKSGSLRRPIVWNSLTLSGKPPGAATSLDISFTGGLPYFSKK